jgi:hypothetical protein
VINLLLQEWASQLATVEEWIKDTSEIEANNILQEKVIFFSRFIFTQCLAPLSALQVSQNIEHHHNITTAFLYGMLSNPSKAPAVLFL